MRAALVAILFLTACATDGEKATPPDAPGTTELPAGCDYELSLDGRGDNATQDSVGPVAVDAVGKKVCLHLDATNNIRIAHFSAGTEYADGTTSPFLLSLHDMQGATLREGWDVTVGQTDPKTFENLEWDAPLGQITDAVVWVRARDASATSTFGFALFEPFE